MDTEHDTNNIASVVLYTGGHEFVLQRRTADAPTGAGLLCDFGGHIQQGEEPLTAANRELHEEVDVDFDSLEYIGVFQHITEPEASDKVKDYYVYAAHVPEQHFQVFEGAGAEWIPAIEIADHTDMLSGTKRAIELFMKEKSWH